jgi:hypothetical protein
MDWKAWFAWEREIMDRLNDKKSKQIFTTFDGFPYAVDRTYVLTVRLGHTINQRAVSSNYDKIPKGWLRLISESESPWCVLGSPKAVSRYKSEDNARQMLTIAGLIGLKADLSVFDTMERPEFREHV